MASANATSSVPYNLDAGRISDFLKGMRESHDASAKTLVAAVGTNLAVRAAWSVYKRRR